MKFKTKPGEIQSIHISTLVEKYNATVEKFEALTFVIYDAYGPVMRIYRGKRKKPFLNLRYQSLQQLANDKLKWKEEEIKRIEEGQAQKAETAAELEKIKPGTIFVSSWGYDQTNIDFYEVTEKNGCLLTVRELRQEREYSSHGYGTCKPIPGKFKKNSEETRHKFQSTGYIKISSFQWASIWDGDPESWTSWA